MRKISKNIDMESFLGYNIKWKWKVINILKRTSVLCIQGNKSPTFEYNDNSGIHNQNILDLNSSFLSELCDLELEFTLSDSQFLSAQMWLLIIYA